MTNKDIVEFYDALKMLAKEKGIDVEYLLDRIRNAIIVAVSRAKQEDLRVRLRQLEEIWDEYDVYEKQVEK